MDFWAFYMFWDKTESLQAFHCGVLSQKEIEDHPFIYFAVLAGNRNQKSFLAVDSVQMISV